MTKKTKKAAKPRPKTVTVKTSDCQRHEAKNLAGDCDQVVRITYEVRR